MRNTVKLALIGRRVDAILCASEATSAAARRLHAPAARIVDLPNAIDLDLFSPASEQERKRARAELGIAQDIALLVHFGWDWRGKGGDIFLAAIGLLSRSGVPVKGLCVGGGQPARAEAAALRLGDLAVVAEPRRRCPLALCGGRCLVSASAAEGGRPYSVLEALSTGTPAD